MDDIQNHRTRNNQNKILKAEKGYGWINRLKKGKSSQQWTKVKINPVHSSELSTGRSSTLATGVKDNS